MFYETLITVYGSARRVEAELAHPVVWNLIRTIIRGRYPTRPEQSTFPQHGTAAHEDAEKAVTGSAATGAQAAAVKSVGSGTAGAVTTDFTGKGYEVTVTKSDGTQVEVRLDSSFTVEAGGHA